MNPTSAPLPPAVDDVAFLGDHPSMLLSASIPVLRDPAQFEPADRQQLEEINRVYVATARTDRIRAAVVAFTRVALQRGMRLIFGAHPTISPLVLQVAEDLDAQPASILVFQSDAYRHEIPGSTLDLANWSRGRLVLTQAQPELVIAPPPGAPALRRLSPYPNSLAAMRALMTSVPGLRGAVFVGGMPGVEDEAALFARVHPLLPRYALPTTGGAAQRLVQQQPQQFHGTLRDPAAFHTTTAYTVAAAKALDELMPPGGRP